MSKASLFINGVEFPVLNPQSFVVSKSKSLADTMCAPLFGDLHLFLKVNANSCLFLNSLTSKENTISGKISVYGILKPGKILYNIEFMEATIEGFNINYDQQEEPTFIELYLKPAIQKVGEMIVTKNLKNNIQSNY